jgi:hypothetical protein
VPNPQGAAILPEELATPAQLVTMQYPSTPHFTREGEQRFELLLESGKL